jgi:hypothetical protein
MEFLGRRQTSQFFGERNPSVGLWLVETRLDSALFVPGFAMRAIPVFYETFFKTRLISFRDRSIRAYGLVAVTVVTVSSGICLSHPEG